ncbi:hypothetical protein OBBRIDRAFT_803739 [Obba rivulosa]|uniref:Uncharacterized protein n=1 Tax=Obba rivulosa TaxID=1052685 RepID=A0A8E2DKR7_9APHY|nr:hypothetical protein OBBRIDRAFT_803739 [Obba rivulosa]
MHKVAYLLRLQNCGTDSSAPHWAFKFLRLRYLYVHDPILLKCKASQTGSGASDKTSSIFHGEDHTCYLTATAQRERNIILDYKVNMGQQKPKPAGSQFEGVGGSPRIVRILDDSEKELRTERDVDDSCLHRMINISNSMPAGGLERGEDNIWNMITGVLEKWNLNVHRVRRTLVHRHRGWLSAALEYVARKERTGKYRTPVIQTDNGVIATPARGAGRVRLRCSSLFESLQHVVIGVRDLERTGVNLSAGCAVWSYAVALTCVAVNATPRNEVDFERCSVPYGSRTTRDAHTGNTMESAVDFGVDCLQT